MTGTKLPIYLGIETLENLALFDDEYPNLNAIAKNHSVIYINCTNEVLNKIISDTESDISQFCLRNDIEIIAAKDIFDIVGKDIDKLSDCARGMYFLNVTPEEAENLSYKYGVIVQSDSKYNDNIFQFSYRKHTEKGEKYDGVENGWKNLLANLKILPSNSLVVTDRYLFGDKEKDIKPGIENLKMVLDALLPTKLYTSFHILVIFRKHNKLHGERLNQICGQIKSYLKNIRNYDIKFEMISDDTIHPRKIISNYYVLNCDKGFQLFSPINHNIIYSNNELRISSILYDPGNTLSDTELKIAIKSLNQIYKFSEDLRLQILNGINESNKKIIGDNDSSKKIHNRLLKI